jgi:hypothetical protein
MPVAKSGSAVGKRCRKRIGVALIIVTLITERRRNDYYS